ncbi:hypothetical protein HY411_02310 [Candidatus Gottesmanbacteria bacterium]|nr:hypothetical protein [Candidatus Gottesmanbacteria bacterium]
MSEQAGVHSEITPLNPSQRVDNALVRFLKSRLPGEKTDRGMKLVDKVITGLPENTQQLAAKIRPVIKAGMYAGNCVGTYMEAMLVASLGVGLIVVGKEGLRMIPNTTGQMDSTAQPHTDRLPTKPHAKAGHLSAVVTTLLHPEPSPFAIPAPDAKRIPTEYLFRLDHAINGMADHETRIFLRGSLAGGEELWDEFKKTGGRSDRMIPGPGDKGEVNFDFAFFLKKKFQDAISAIDTDYGHIVMDRIYAKADENPNKRISDEGIQAVLGTIRDEVGIDLRPIYNRIEPERDAYLMLIHYVLDLEKLSNSMRQPDAS